MPRNIFLSFPGTNNYVECNYHPEGRPEERVPNVKYVQEALLRLYARDFGEGDLAFFFLTRDARARNWGDDGQWNSTTRQYDLPNTGLDNRLKALRAEGAFRGAVRDVTIPEGFSAAEIWAIFQTVYDCLEPGDRVILDITHAFRSLPMLGMVLIHYAKALKTIEVAGIYYGAFEKLGLAAEVGKLPIEERNAPVVDLRSFSELQDWTAAAHDFVQYGNPGRWNRLTHTAITPILAASFGEDEVAGNLRLINKYMQDLIPLIQTNRGAELRDFPFDNLGAALDAFSADRSFVKPLNPIIELVRKKIAPFREAGTMRWLEGVRWCLIHGLTQQGLTQLQEGLLTWLCQYFNQLGVTPGFFDWQQKEPRELISSALSFLPDPPPEEKWGGSIGLHKETGRKVLHYPITQILATVYQQLGKTRNDISHGGYAENRKADTFFKTLDQSFQTIFEVITQELDVLERSPTGLLNLSNHPSPAWPPDQRQAALDAYGAIEDLPFPAIDPAWSSADVDALAADYLARVIRRRPAAVHLMGEMTFTLALVQKLKAAGIPCLASTTERLAREEAGNKVVAFRFVQFREYT